MKHGIINNARLASKDASIPKRDERESEKGKYQFGGKEMKLSNEKVGVMVVTVVLLLSAITPFITLAQGSSIIDPKAIITTDTRLWDVNAPLSDAQKAQINASGITLSQAQVAEIKANMLKLRANAVKNAGESVQAHSKELMDTGKVPVINGPTTIQVGENIGKSSITGNLVSPLSAVSYYGANAHDFSGPLPNGGSGMGTFIQENDVVTSVRGIPWLASAGVLMMDGHGKVIHLCGTDHQATTM